MADEAEEQTTETETTTPDLDAILAENEKMRRALKERNAEEAKRRKRIEELEAAEEARKTAEMTELDKMRAEKEAADRRALDADERARLTLIRAAFVSEAAKQGAAYPEDVHRLADLSGVDVDETGAVTGVAEAVKSLVDAGRVPLQGKVPAPKLDGGAGGNDRPGTQVKLTAEELEIARKLQLTPEKYAENKAALKARQEE